MNQNLLTISLLFLLYKVLVNYFVHKVHTMLPMQQTHFLLLQNNLIKARRFDSFPQNQNCKASQPKLKPLLLQNISIRIQKSHPVNYVKKRLEFCASKALVKKKENETESWRTSCGWPRKSHHSGIPRSAFFHPRSVSPPIGRLIIRHESAYGNPVAPTLSSLLLVFFLYFFLIKFFCMTCGLLLPLFVTHTRHGFCVSMWEMNFT